MASVGGSGRRAADTARRAADSRWIERTARVGLAARGLVYVLIGILAFQIAFVDRAERADQKGAFQTLAQNGFGKAVLWIVIVGFVGYGVWQATEAAWGHRTERDDRKRTANRLESAVKAVIYLMLAVVAFRVGLAARGLVYLLIGILAFQIAFVDRAERADQKGAFQTLVQNGFGKAVLWIVIIGFVGYGVWQATEAAWGHRRERDDRKRTANRVESAVKAVIYLVLAVVAFRVVTGSSRGGQGGEQVTAEVLTMTGGRFLVGLAGVVIVAAAVVLTWRGLRTKFEEHLDLAELGPRARSTVINLGKVGYIARGIVFALVGILVVAAAVTFDPDKARGMDAALRQVAAQPYGPWLLSLMALGLMCFGVYSFAESRYRRL